MKQKRKGVELITFLLIGLIGITAAGTAWHFGNEILSKQQTSQELKEAEEMLLALEKIIEDVSIQKLPETFKFNLKGKLTIDQTAETITYTLRTESSSYGTTEVLLNDWLPADSVGVKGANRYGVLSVKSLTISPGEQTVQYTLKFRPLEDPEQRRRYVIDLASPKQSIKDAGSVGEMIVEGKTEVSNYDPKTKKHTVTLPIDLDLD